MKPKPKMDDLEALIVAAGMPEAPADLGNLPAEHAEMPEDEAHEAPPAPAPADDDPADEAPPAEGSWAARMAALEASQAALQRENEFLRAGQRPAAAPEPTPDPMDVINRFLPGSVTPEDMRAALEDPVRGAEYLTNLMRASAIAGANMAVQASAAQTHNVVNAQSQAQTLRERFWAQNADLENVGDLVQLSAQAVWNQYGGRVDQDTLIAETARRTRARCDQLGIKLGDAPAKPGLRSVAGGRATRRRPAFAEGGAAPAGRTPQTNTIEREILQLANLQR